MNTLSLDVLQVECIVQTNLRIELRYRDKSVHPYDFSEQQICDAVFDEIAHDIWRKGFLAWGNCLFLPSTLFSHEKKWTTEAGYHIALSFKCGYVHCICAEDADELEQFFEAFIEKLEEYNEIFGIDSKPPTMQ